MKRAVTLVLCLVMVAVGLWVLSASHTLESACTISGQTGGGHSCVNGVPFQLLGLALTAAGVASAIFVLWSSIRARRQSRRERSTISTLPQHQVESLRDVA
jgi:hypothetical protein